MNRPGPVLLCLVGAALPGAAQVSITEFQAANRTGLTDRDGYTSDWVEVHNAGPDVVNLAGHLLSDDGERRQLWRFPPVELAPGGYRIVYLSGKDRTRRDRPLHANFRLARGGGELWLTSPDRRTVLSRIHYGEQHDDVSQGYAQPYEATVLLAAGAEARFVVPNADTRLAWKNPDYDDADWSRGAGGLGYERGKQRTFGDALGTDVGDAMRGVSSSAFYRFEFEVDDPAAFDLCVLRMRFESGFAAYLNGAEIARRRAPVELDFDSAADVGLEPRDPHVFESFGIADARALLRRGRNVLAVHGLVESPNSVEHLVLPEIVGYTVGPVRADRLLYLDRPTPGRPNGGGHADIAPAPRISAAGGLVERTARVSLDAPLDTEVRYTLDGSEPHSASPLYDGPLEVERSCLLKARGFRPGARPSTTATAAFTALDPELREFSSNLPLVVVSTFGREVRAKSFVDAHLHVVAPDESRRASLLGPADFSGYGAFKMRGSSTLERPKKSYGFELRDAAGHDRPAALAGLPADADWVLYGPHNWDQSHIRNALCMELARWVGLEAPRCRFVEVFVNPEDRALRSEDYIGLYVLMERISRGRHRVDVEELKPDHDREPALTGGYILKIDRPGPGDMGFTAGGQRLQFVYPKEREVTEAQREWLETHFEGLARALEEPLDDGGLGYAAWIDVDNWIDYHFFNEYAKNPDAFTLSTYLYKRRGEVVRMGPIWDHDRSMRTNDESYWVGRPTNPAGWTSDTDYGWWGPLLQDEAFRHRYRQRGRAFLANELALEKVLALVDAYAAEVEEAEERDRRRWPIIRPGKWYDEIAELKDWIRSRDTWLRSELIDVPRFTTSTGSTEPPFELTIDHAGDGGTIYYTVGGSDPALMDGTLSPLAQVYSGPVSIEGPAEVQARVLVDNVWSKVTRASFLTKPLTLSVSEVMYNPAEGGDYEFVEIANHGDEPVSLDGVVIDGGIRFYFGIGEVRSLDPGERAVIVRDRHHFADRYDVTTMHVAGEYFGRLSNTEAVLTLTGPYGELVARAHYADSWFPETDAGGVSLEAREPGPYLDEREQWRPSTEEGGTPGR